MEAIWLPRSNHVHKNPDFPTGVTPGINFYYVVLSSFGTILSVTRVEATGPGLTRSDGSRLLDRVERSGISVTCLLSIDHSDQL